MIFIPYIYYKYHNIDIYSDKDTKCFESAKYSIYYFH